LRVRGRTREAELPAQGRSTDVTGFRQASSSCGGYAVRCGHRVDVEECCPRLLGESFAGAWPQREGEFADLFNTMPKFVVSTTLKDPEWNNTTVLDSGDATAEVRKLKDEFEGVLQIPGSHRLVQELLAADLVDQINLMVFPVILGTGKKAFEEAPERRNLQLKESKVVGNGVLVVTYERAA